MTQFTTDTNGKPLTVTIPIATLEQIVDALETGRWNTRALANKDYHDDNDKINAALTSLRAALANAEPTDSYDLAKRADNGGQP